MFDVYLRQIFGEGYFHADPHPGNLFVEPLGPRPATGNCPFRLVFVDFGMVGQVPTLMGEQFREVMLALTLRDASRMVRAFQRLGFLLPGADLRRVEEATALLLERFWGMSMEQLTQVDYVEMHALAVEFRDLLFDLPFQVPHDFIFLGRAVGILSGLSTTLDPQFNPWHAIERYGKKLLQEERGRAGLGQLFQTAVEMLRPLVTLPIKLEGLLDQASRGELALRMAPDRSLEDRMRRMERATGRLLWGLVGSALLLAGTVLFVSDEAALGVVGWGLAGISVLWGLVNGRRR